MKAAALFAAFLAAASPAADIAPDAPGDGVFVSLRETGTRGGKALFSLAAELSNAENSYRLTFANLRAHANEGRRFELKLDNGLSSGFSALVDAVGISVNGIDARKLQPRRDGIREWEGERGERGVAVALNFDGARVVLRFSMRPGSPALWCELAKAPDASGAPQLSPVADAAVVVKAIPSFLDHGGGRPTRFFGYAREARTAARVLSLPPNRAEPLQPGDHFVVFQDAEHDGSADGRGMGPSATWPLEPVAGRIVLDDAWTTRVEYAPDLSRPFRFALLEYRSRRIPNAEFPRVPCHE